MPWSKRNGDHKREDDDCDSWDRHTVPRCRHCGGETRFRRFHKANPKPGIWFACLNKPSAKCTSQQSINRDKN